VPGRGKDQPHLDVGGDLFEVGRGEVAAVIGVEHFGDAEDRPVRVGPPPDRLPERQCRLHGGRAVERKQEAGDGAAVVIDDDGQPRTCRRAIVASGPEIELGVIGLPDLVGTLGFAAMNQIVGFAIGFLAIQSERLQRVGDGTDDVVDGVVAGGRLPCGARNTADLPMDRTWAERRLLQGQAFGEVAQVVRDTTAFALIGPSGTGQPGKPKPVVTADPALEGAQRKPQLPGNARQRLIAFKVRSELSVAFHGALTLPLGQLTGACARRGPARSGCHSRTLRQIIFKILRQLLFKMTRTCPTPAFLYVIMSRLTHRRGGNAMSRVQQWPSWHG
jgi:hypothetical protein